MFYWNNAYVSGPGVRQYRVNLDGTDSGYSQGWTSPEMIHDMERQQVEAATSTASFSGQFAPAWPRQKMFLAIPTQEEQPTKEWRLCSRIVSIGELMLTLGSKYSAHDIELFWRSMTIAAEKRQVKEHRNNKKRAAD